MKEYKHRIIDERFAHLFLEISVEDPLAARILQLDHRPTPLYEDIPKGPSATYTLLPAFSRVTSHESITPAVAPVWQRLHYLFMVGISADSMSEEKMELSWELFGELCRALALRVAREAPWWRQYCSASFTRSKAPDTTVGKDSSSVPRSYTLRLPSWRIVACFWWMRSATAVRR